MHAYIYIYIYILANMKSPFFIIGIFMVFKYDMVYNYNHFNVGEI